MHVLVDITAHGLGHLAQTAPVVEALARARPNLRLTLRTDLPLAALERRIRVPFELLKPNDEFGLLMTSSFTVDVAATAARYRRMHAELPEVVRDFSGWLVAHRVDAVLSNVGYMVLAAGLEAGIPCVAFSTINWRDVVGHYCAAEPGMAVVLDEMAGIYRAANRFLRLEPGLDMPWLDTVRVPQIIVGEGRNRRAEIIERCGLSPKATIVAFSFSESETAPPPRIARAELEAVTDGIVFLGPSHWCDRAPFRSFAEVGFPFIDLVWSSDLVVAKPGYGLSTEAARADTPVLFVPRDDWPESATVAAWQERHGRFRDAARPLNELTLADILDAHRVMAPLRPKEPPEIRGEEIVAAAFLAHLA